MRKSISLPGRQDGKFKFERCIGLGTEDPVDQMDVGHEGEEAAQ